MYVELVFVYFGYCLYLDCVYVCEVVDGVVVDFEFVDVVGLWFE